MPDEAREHDDEDERGPSPDVEQDGAGDAAVGRRHPGNVDAQRGQRHGDQPALVGEEGHAEIADRHFEGEQRRADDRAERPRSRSAEIDQPRREKAEHQFDGNGHHDENHGDEDAVPEPIGGENVDVVGEADVSGDPFAQHVIGEAVADHRDQREKGERDNPEDRGQEQRVFERAAAFQAPNPSRRRHLPSFLRFLPVIASDPRVEDPGGSNPVERRGPTAPGLLRLGSQ